jgi:hypothetical protein
LRGTSWADATHCLAVDYYYTSGTRYRTVADTTPGPHQQTVNSGANPNPEPALSSRLQAVDCVAGTAFHNDDRVGQLRRGNRDQLEMELGEIWLRPADLTQPGHDPLMTGGRQRVHLAVTPRRRPRRPLALHKPRLLQPGQHDVDLTVIHRLTKRSKRVAQPARSS